jgi:excisionase family DNA binding protein
MAKRRKTPKPGLPPILPQAPTPKPAIKPTPPKPVKPRLPRPAPQPQFITIAEAAARLGVSEKTIRRWIAAGLLAAVRMGSQIRISVSALLHFISTLHPAKP